MALRKERFSSTYERAGTMKNDRQSSHQSSIPVEINDVLYYRVKAAAAVKHLTMRQYLESLLDEVVPETSEVVQQGHPPTHESIEQLRKFREGLFSKQNYQYMENSVEELREIREERLMRVLDRR